MYHAFEPGKNYKNNFFSLLMKEIKLSDKFKKCFWGKLTNEDNLYTLIKTNQITENEILQIAIEKNREFSIELNTYVAGKLSCDNLELYLPYLENSERIRIISCSSMHNILTEEYMEKYQDMINWKSVSQYQKLSESFILRHKYKLDWGKISKYQKISKQFIIDNAHLLDFFNLKLNENLDNDAKSFLKFIYIA